MNEFRPVRRSFGVRRWDRIPVLLSLAFFLLSAVAACTIGSGPATTPTSAGPTSTSAGATAPTSSVAPTNATGTAIATRSGVSTPGATPSRIAGPILVAPTRVDTPTPRGEQALTLALGSTDPTFDPALVRDANSSFLVRQLFRGLVRLDQDLNVVPDLAERIAISDDGLTYTFTLRANAVFHDGKAIDAAAVRYSLERATDPALAGGRGAALPGATYLGDIAGAQEKLAGRATSLAGVRAVDPRTVEIRLAAPKAYFLMKLSYPISAVVDEANVRAGGSAWARKPNGSGPFVVERVTADQISLRRFDRFYAGAPTLERVTILYGQAANSPMNLYEAGRIDFMRVPLSSADRVLVENSPLKAQVTVTPSLSLTYVGFNVTMPPYDDPAVRRAFVQAINRERLATVSLEGKGVQANGIVPPTMPGGPWDGRPLPYDVAAARAALASSRYAAALPRASIYGASGTLGVTMRKVYERDLAVPLEVIDVDWPDYLEGLSARAYPAFEITWIADYPDPENFLALLFGTGSGENHTGYSNPDVDRLLADAAKERDPARRRELYLQAQQSILDDAVIIPAYHSIDYTLVKPTVKGLQITPLGVLDLDSVWIER
jgi:peptide/nickel transport system substrate-binding protein/oligopeptide transport system substrate-binding protein